MDGKTQAAAAASAGMSERAARTWAGGALPSARAGRTWRTRVDPFVGVWEAKVVPWLEADREGVLEAKTLLELLIDEKPGVFGLGQLRTLQRRVHHWRALYGPEREVYFPQEHPPGREAAIDFTHGDALGVTIEGEWLRHLLFEFVLSHSVLRPVFLRWIGLTFALDGSTLRVADTAANEEVYGRPGSSRAPAAYPQARIVSLIAVGSRLVPNFVVGSLDQGEQILAQMLFPGLPDHSLVILDRGFVNFATFVRIPRSGIERHFLCRGKENLRMTLVRSLGKNDSLVQIRLSARQRKDDPTLPETLIVRKLDYQIPGFRPSTLLTSLLDAELYPAKDLTEFYHKRWEIELSYDEIKTDTLEQKESLRSKSLGLVLQEIYGLLIAYNLVRVMMARAARDAGVEPCRMSFRNSLIHVRYFLVIAAVVAPGNLPQLIRKLAADLALLVLPTRRTRRYPRAVKIKMTSYKRKPVK